MQHNCFGWLSEYPLERCGLVSTGLAVVLVVVLRNGNYARVGLAPQDLRHMLGEVLLQPCTHKQSLRDIAVNEAQVVVEVATDQERASTAAHPRTCHTSKLSGTSPVNSIKLRWGVRVYSPLRVKLIWVACLIVEEAWWHKRV